MKIKVTVALQLIAEVPAFFHDRELREFEIDVESHPEIVRTAFKHVLDTEPDEILQKLFGLQVYSYISMDENIGKSG